MSDFLYEWIAKETTGFDCAVEFGTMYGDKIAAANTSRKVGIEIHPPYFHFMDNYPEIRAVHGNFIDFESLLAPDEYGVAMMIDTIEHVETKTARDLIRRMQQRFQKILIWTPCGFVENETDDGNPYQQHRSGWEVADFQRLDFQRVTQKDTIIWERHPDGSPDHSTDKKQSFYQAVWRKQ